MINRDQDAIRFRRSTLPNLESAVFSSHNKRVDFLDQLSTTTTRVQLTPAAKSFQLTPVTKSFQLTSAAKSLQLTPAAPSLQLTPAAESLQLQPSILGAQPPPPQLPDRQSRDVGSEWSATDASRWAALVLNTYLTEKVAEDVEFTNKGWLKQKGNNFDAAQIGTVRVKLAYEISNISFFH